VKQSLEHLIARMCEGDTDALEQVFLAFEPGLHNWVKRHLTTPLRSKLDSSDIILATWLDVLRHIRRSGRFSDANHFRRFLYILMRNRTIDYIRQQNIEIRIIGSLEGAETDRAFHSPDPSPSEIAQAGELWQRIVDLCPPEHRPILELRRDGHTLGEIAAHTGLHPDSIRRILRILARQVLGEP
jgi:RNA polymerase sigma factor (sigma-70 family)